VKEESKVLDQVRNNIRRAISELLDGKVEGESRLKLWLEKIIEGALVKEQYGAAVAALTMALRFGPGEVTRQEIEHSGKVISEDRVLILPQPLSADEWTKKHQTPETDQTH
jgi:hypothetical protein